MKETLLNNLLLIFKLRLLLKKILLKGRFSIGIENALRKNLKTSYLGYKSKKIILLQGVKHYKIILEESPNNLQEIVIKSLKYKETVRLKKDTLRFFKNTKLKDLLKDNEGIEITDENGIKFMGVPINKILINPLCIMI